LDIEVHVVDCLSPSSSIAQAATSDPHRLSWILLLWD
jgi:hypothetical protein